MEASTPYTVELRGAPSNVTEVSFVTELGVKARGCCQCVTRCELCRGFCLHLWSCFEGCMGSRGKFCTGFVQRC